MFSRTLLTSSWWKPRAVSLLLSKSVNRVDVRCTRASVSFRGLHSTSGKRSKEESGLDLDSKRNANAAGFPTSSGQVSQQNSTDSVKDIEKATAAVDIGTSTPPPSVLPGALPIIAVKGLGKKVTNIKHNIHLFKDYYRDELFTIPNIITYTRMFCSPFLGWAIVHDYKQVALAGCAIAAFSDWLDGYIAKNYDQMTVLGGMIDPAADKIMIGCLTAGIAIKGLIPLELAALIVGRDIVLLGASFYIRYREMPVGTPFFDTTYSATFEIIPSNLSKLNTVLQFSLISTTLLHWGLDAGTLMPTTMHVSLGQVLVPMQLLTAATTVGSSLGYLDGSAVKRLSPTGVRRGRGEHELEEEAEEEEEEGEEEGSGPHTSGKKKK